MITNALLIIDPQNDFCNPGNEAQENRGALYVENAEKDMQRLAKWIDKNSKNINYIGITTDNHQLNDISHPNFWVDKNGNHPAPFTQITALEAETGKWNACFKPQLCLEYLKKLEAQGEYAHIIWPPHCLSGSEGAAIFKPIMNAVVKWAAQGNFYEIISKGSYPFTEHFGAFRAQIPYEDQKETQLNVLLLNKLSTFDNIYISGEAKSHCVANSLKQMLEEAPELAEKIIILEDTMSDVTGFETQALPIFKKAETMGVKFTTTNKVVFV